MRIATKPFTLPTELINQIKFMSPNIYELNEIAKHFGCLNLIDNTEDSVEQLFEKDPNLLSKIKDACIEISKNIDNIIITFGSHGVLMASKTSSAELRILNDNLVYNKPNNDNKVQCRFYNVDKLTNVVNVSGAGDSFNIGFITAMINGYNEENCISVGLESAKTALNSTDAVPVKYFEKNHPCWKHAAVYKNI